MAIVPFRHSDERIHRALSRLYAEYIRPAGFTIHMHPAVLYDMRTDPFMLTRSVGDLSRIWGLPVQVDHRLPEHGITLRYEVEA
ncbi:MAG TPA: hypothetical protein VK204_01205 [Nocardioidaceae bacterium]|nr:hypothetical protein [Nocardioidaceae bacterium]